MPGVLHGFGHVKQTSHVVTIATGELDAAKANAANLVAQLQVATADKQQLSTNLADLGIIKTELEAKLPSGCSNFISNWNHKLFDHSFSVLTFHEGWSAIFVSADLNRSRWLAASEVAFPI